MSEQFRSALESIAGWRKVNISSEYENGLRDIIRSITDCAAAALEAAPQPVVPAQGSRDQTRLPDEYDNGFSAGRQFELNRQIKITFDRDFLGQMVRHAWVEWAKQQDAPKPHWLFPYAELSEADKEADRQIGEYLIEWAKKYVPATLARGGDGCQVLIHQLREMATEFSVDNKTDCKQHVCWIAADRLSGVAQTEQVREALTLGRDAVMESFDHVADRDDQLLADARLQSIDAAIAQHSPRCDRCGSSGDTYVLCSGCGMPASPPYPVQSALRECASRCRYDGDLFHDQGNIARRDASWKAADMAEAALSALSCAQGSGDCGEIERMVTDAMDTARREAIEECAQVAEAQKQTFLSPEYASNQPYGSLCERFACDEVANAIRVLSLTSTDRGGK